MLHSQCVIICLFFFADNTFILLKYFVFYCQSQGRSNKDTCTTWVWLFHKHLVLHLVEGFVKEMQNNKSNPDIINTLRATCLARVLEKALSSSPGAMGNAFSSWSWKTHREQARPVSPRKARLLCVAVLAALCQSLLAAAAPVSPKGPRQPGELSEPQELMSF